MMKTLGATRLSLCLALLPLATLPSCAADEGEGGEGGGPQCAGGKCDEVAPEDFACKDLVDHSGRGVDNVLEQLGDPFAELALKRGGDGCPTTFAEVMRRLRENDTDDRCKAGGDGMESRFISEKAPFENATQVQVRSVTTRTCNGRKSFELIFSLFGVSKDRMPAGAEIIAFDREAGEFNYYEAANGDIEFFGSSTDLIKGTGGRCKTCHTAGGLIMKELRSPWVHWEQHDKVTGPIIDKFKDDLGSSTFSRGSNMESLTNAGNDKWNDTKVLKMTNPDGGFEVRDMLTPLFCSKQVNIDTAATFTSEPREIPQAFFAHCKLFGSGTSCSSTHFGESGGVSLTSGVYAQAIADAGQTLPEVSGATDTVFPMPFIEPTVEDVQYLDKLVAAGAIDDDFVVDALAMDFTRPVFSAARCGLLDFAPTWDDIEREATPDRIRDAFIANLEAAMVEPNTVAGQFLAALQTPDDASAHRQAVSDFMKACNDRDDAAFMADALVVADAVRTLATEEELFEFPATMPVLPGDPREGAHFDALTCELAAD